MGHSLGGGQAFYVMKYFHDKQYGEDGSLVLSIDGWFDFSISKSDLNNLETHASLLQMNNLDGTGTDLRIHLSIWSHINKSDKSFYTLPYTSQGNKKISLAEDVYTELKSFSIKQQEYFFVITVDGASHIINTRTVFIGTLNQTLVHPREVFAYAIADRAAGIIIAHTHPSGTLSTSRADIATTQRLEEVSKLVGIEFLDHVILVKNGFYSFTDEVLL